MERACWGRERGGLQLTHSRAISAQCLVLTPPTQSSPRKLTSESSPFLGQQEGDYLTGSLELSSSKIWLCRELWGSRAQILCLPAVGIK